jgi:hypothetical protein
MDGGERKYYQSVRTSNDSSRENIPEKKIKEQIHTRLRLNNYKSTTEEKLAD